MPSGPVFPVTTAATSKVTFSDPGAQPPAIAVTGSSAASVFSAATGTYA